MPLGWRKQYLRYKEYFMDIVSLYNRRQDLRIFLELLLTLGAIIFFAVVALRPTALTISQLLTDIKTKEELVSKLDQKIVNIQKARQVYDQESQRVLMAKDAVPNGPTPESLSRQIEGLAQRNGDTILGFSVQEVILVGKEGALSTEESKKALPGGSLGLSFSVSVTGSYQGLTTFLDNLENIRRPIKIDTLSLTANNSESGQKIILLVTGRVPYIK